MTLKDISYWGLVKIAIIPGLLIAALIVAPALILEALHVLPNVSYEITELDEPKKILGLLILGDIPV